MAQAQNFAACICRALGSVKLVHVLFLSEGRVAFLWVRAVGGFQIYVFWTGFLPAVGSVISGVKCCVL